jgi:hypothetical protein
MLRSEGVRVQPPGDLFAYLAALVVPLPRLLESDLMARVVRYSETMPHPATPHPEAVHA